MVCLVCVLCRRKECFIVLSRHATIHEDRVKKYHWNTVWKSSHQYKHNIFDDKRLLPNSRCFHYFLSTLADFRTQSITSPIFTLLNLSGFFFHFLSKATILTCKIEMHYATYMHICVAICIQMYVIMVLLQWFTFSINFSLTAVRISADSSIAWSSKSKVARLGLGLHTQHVLLMKQNLHLYAYSWCLFCCLLGDFL